MFVYFILFFFKRAGVSRQKRDLNEVIQRMNQNNIKCAAMHAHFSHPELHKLLKSVDKDFYLELFLFRLLEK